MIDQKYLLEILETLCRTPSPTGFTQHILPLLEKEFNQLGLQPVRSHNGSISAIINGKSGNVRKVLAAHIDTLGAMVKDIKDNGRLVFSPVGSYMANSIECENCQVHTASGKVVGGTVFSLKPSVHVHSDARSYERRFENMEILLDEKIRSKDETKALGVEIGDFITFDSRFTVTEKGFVKTRHLDDKAGVAILLSLCRAIKESGGIPADSVQIMITAYEEVGHGACSGIDPTAQELLCIDMGAPGEGQNSDEYTVSICAKDSGGPYNYELRSRLVQLAKAQQIDYRVDLYPNYSSDALAALKAGYNLRTALIGPGVYASHSYERTHIDSIEYTARLALAYMMES